MSLQFAVLLAALIFVNFVLAIAATIFAVKAVSHEVMIRQWCQVCQPLLFADMLSNARNPVQVDELKVKQREEYGRLGVMSDTLAFEMDGNPG